MKLPGALVAILSGMWWWPGKGLVLRLAVFAGRLFDEVFESLPGCASTTKNLIVSAVDDAQHKPGRTSLYAGPPLLRALER